MPNDSSDFQLVCPKCGAPYASHASACPQCGQVNAAAPPAPPPSRQRKPKRGPILPDLSVLIKIALILLAIAIPAWLLYRISNSLFHSIEQASPYPTNPADTTTQFFKSLQQEDYQDCYSLLAKERKMATVIAKNSRNNYFQHFARIRDYLIERVEPDFTWDMEISYDGKQAQFGTEIVLTLSLVPTRGIDKRSHYAIKEINEFPLDIAPTIGVEKYQRQLSRVAESIDALDQDEKEMDPADILESRPHENLTARRNRWLEAFEFQRQLDTRHTLLEWIIREYPQDRTVETFLAKIARDDSEVSQLRRLAQTHLSR